MELVSLRANLKIYELTGDTLPRHPHDSLAEAVLDPYVNAIHVSLLREKKLNPIYAEQLEKLGADMVLADQHRVFINGPTPLRAAQVVCPPALRPATIILIGMLAAKGTSMLRNVYSINRGYEDLANRLNLLGAKIKTFQEL